MGFSGWGEPSPRALLSWATGPRGGQGCPRLLPALCSSPSQVDPYLPYEYTCEGMLERIHAYIQHQVGDHGGASLFSWATISVLPRGPSPCSRGSIPLPLGKQPLTSAAPQRRTPESTRRWGLGEVFHEPKMLGGLVEGGWGCWGWLKVFLLQRIRQHGGRKRWSVPSCPTAGDAIHACR